MDEQKLKEKLGGICGYVRAVSETGSTNVDARALIADPDFRRAEVDAALLTADCQTGGHGRQGKRFISPYGGLYMTLIMRTDVPIESVVNVTSCAAVAVARAVARTSGADCGIKWVNDIYLNGAKLSGILAESINDYTSMKSEYVIIGIGVNVNNSGFPEGLCAVSLRDAGFSVDIGDLCAAITRELIGIRATGFDFSKYAEEYRSRSIVIGREIMFTKNGAVMYGTAESINEHGGLVVRCGDETCVLDSGEITVRVNEQ